MSVESLLHVQAVLEGQAPPSQGPSKGPAPTGKLSRQVRQLLAQALAHFRAANAALQRGDLGTYQSEIQQAEALISQANRAGGTSRTGSSSSPTPSPSPSA